MIIWHPIEELKDRYAADLLLYAPELVDEDFNVSGVGMGHWQDDGDLEDGGQWEANKWNGTADEWYTVACTPTHFAHIVSPHVVIGTDLTDFEAGSIANSIDAKAGGYFRRMLISSAKSGARVIMARIMGAPT